MKSDGKSFTEDFIGNAYYAVENTDRWIESILNRYQDSEF